MNRIWIACSAALLAAGLSTTTGAQSAGKFPERPIRMIVPLPPGGGTDLLARTVTQRAAELWGQTVLIDNRGGAGGTIGADLVAKAEPDGYTLLFTHLAPISVNPSLKKLPYDPLTDLAAVTMIAVAPNVIIVHPSLQAATVNELIALLKAKPGFYHYGTGGSGTSPHLSAELFKMMTGTDIIHVPYKGFGPAVTDLLSGQIEIYFASIPAARPLIKAGKVRPIAVTSLKRSALMPEMPSISEAGVRGFESIQWYGILAPARTPDRVIQKLYQDITATVMKPEAKQKLFELGYEVVGDNPKEFSAFIRSDLERWAKVIKAAGIRAD